MDLKEYYIAYGILSVLMPIFLWKEEVSASIGVCIILTQHLSAFITFKAILDRLRD